MTITNTSAVPVTWHINGDLSQLDITPTSSTLAPGEAIAVSVIPKLGVFVGQNLSVDADNAPSQSLSVFLGQPGAYIQIPPDIDFGNVPLGSAPSSVFIPIPSFKGNWPGIGLFGPFDGPISVFNGPPQPQTGGLGWTLTINTQLNSQFLPLGPVQVTFDFVSEAGGTICTPSSFTARAVIVAAQ